MSQPHLDLTPLGTNTTNRKMSPIDLISVETKTPEPTPQILPTDSPTLPMDLPEKDGKAYVPVDPDPDLSSSDSSLNKSNLSNYINSIKSIKKKRDKKKKRQKYRRHT